MIVFVQLLAVRSRSRSPYSLRSQSIFAKRLPYTLKLYYYYLPYIGFVFFVIEIRIVPFHRGRCVCGVVVTLLCPHRKIVSYLCAHAWPWLFICICAWMYVRMRVFLLVCTFVYTPLLCRFAFKLSTCIYIQTRTHIDDVRDWLLITWDFWGLVMMVCVPFGWERFCFLYLCVHHVNMYANKLTCTHSHSLIH